MTLDPTLKINTCPHCSSDYPNMESKHMFATSYDNGVEPKNWGVYVCKRCGGAVLAVAYAPNVEVAEVYPNIEVANVSLPEDAQEFLNQAMRSISTPSGSVILSASAVDAMLKALGYNDKSSLFSRIGKATEDGVLTKGMRQWADHIRLEANGQRHADTEASFPTIEDAQLSVEFAKTLGDFLFIIPAKVKLGIKNSDPVIPKKKKLSGKSPLTLKLPKAYRASSYRHSIQLENSITKPVVTAKLFYTNGGQPLSESIQPPELVVSNRSGNPRWWEAELFIPTCQSLPANTIVNIIVDGEIRHSGTLCVDYSTI